MIPAETTIPDPSCCAPVDVAPVPAPVAVAPVMPDPVPPVEVAAPPAPVAPEPVHDVTAAPAPAADAGGSPWTMSGPGVDQPPAGTDGHTGLSFPGDQSWAMSGANVDATLSGTPDTGSAPHAGPSGDTPFTGMSGPDVDHALASAPAEPHHPSGDGLGFGPLPGFHPDGSGAINDMGNGVAGLPTIFDIIGQTGDDNSRLILGNVNGLDHSTGDADHDGIPDFADSDDGSY